MSDSIQIDRWSRPWSPTPETELVETLNYYDMPLLGILEQQGVRFLFRCVAGQVDSTHLWAYRLLTEAEREKLDRVDSPDILREVVATLFSTGPITIALASDDPGILGSTEVSTLDMEDLRLGLDRLIEDFRLYVHAKEAEVEASASDLLASASSS